ncbi:hypothetical protein [Anaeromyxobacter paludicola]|uniref:Uncharacterized protein n=1 Tax=Anaeromyxobacter paludicola TaxID=2918171 RepID=A0ABN6NBV3_9BACT|nr:hypothetical protein [Anaeromyxobacter paludicola]BDG09480.1 hypothetical protein AMPC_25930 [Anaeromyxobacter paludicola]
MKRATYVALLEGGREETVEVSMEAPGRYEVRIAGEVHRVDAFRHDHGTLSLLLGTESYAVTIDEKKSGLEVHLRDSVYRMELVEARRLRMRRAAAKPGR